MNMVIHLIGVHHSIQHNGGNFWAIPGLSALREQFQYYLVRTIREFRISVLAEELNEDVLAIFNASESMAASSARKAGISHVFCEPGLRLRSSLGFTKQLQGKHHVVRERLWYEKIMVHRSERVLFICGANHVSTFSRLVREKGHAVVILTPYYGRNFFQAFTSRQFCQSLCPHAGLSHEPQNLSDLLIIPH